MNKGIVDYGLISSLGLGKEETATKLFAPERSALSPVELINGKQTFIGAISSKLLSFPDYFEDLKSRNNQLVYSVYKQIEKSFLKLQESIEPKKIGIVLGTSTSGISDVEKAFSYRNQSGKFPEDYHYKKHEMGSPAEFLAKLTGCQGPAYTVSCACSSGSKALAAASRLLEAGVCELVITGGIDTLCDLTLLGFNSLEVISEQPCLPFSKNRDGINIGEAGALFLMTNNKADLNLVAYGESSDAHHHSAPHPEGIGAINSMKSALKMARLNHSDVDYINLHGTGTIQNDSMEAKALKALSLDSTACSSTKSLTGHTLGAAGAVEAAFSLLAIEHQKHPNHHWDENFDPDIPPLNFVKNNKAENRVNYVLSNSYAFGGNNCSLILGGC